MSLGKTVSRSKIKSAIQNFITVCQQYCSYPLNPHRLVFPCLWQMCLSAFSIAKMFADSLIRTSFQQRTENLAPEIALLIFLTKQMRNRGFGHILIHDYLFICFIFLH